MKEIQIPNDSYRFKEGKEEEEEEEKFLKNLSKVNILIGKNNNGKSRFLRSLFSNDLIFKPDNDDINKINGVLNDLKENLFVDSDFKKTHKLDFTQSFQNIEYLKANNYLKIYEYIPFLEEILEKYAKYIEAERSKGVEPHYLSKEKKILMQEMPF